MNVTRRLRRNLLIALVAAVAMAASLGWTAPRAQAFLPQWHDKIVRDALPPDTVDPTAIWQIIGGLPNGLGAVGSDLFPTDAFRHVDSANTPEAICGLVQQAWDFFTPLVIAGAQPTGPGLSGLVDGLGARAAFGGLVHTLSDFYSHSNWVELSVAAGEPDRLAPGLFPKCDPNVLPAGLHTGFYNLNDGIDGCPVSGPPPGFSECHETMNKDSYDTPRGGLQVAGLEPFTNNFDLALRDATKATTDLYWQIRTYVADTINGENMGADGECVSRNLFQADRFEQCLR